MDDNIWNDIPIIVEITPRCDGEKCLLEFSIEKKPNHNTEKWIATEGEYIARFKTCVHCRDRLMSAIGGKDLIAERKCTKCKHAFEDHFVRNDHLTTDWCTVPTCICQNFLGKNSGNGHSSMTDARIMEMVAAANKAVSAIIWSYETMV